MELDRSVRSFPTIIERSVLRLSRRQAPPGICSASAAAAETGSSAAVFSARWDQGRVLRVPFPAALVSALAPFFLYVLMPALGRTISPRGSTERALLGDVVCHRAGRSSRRQSGAKRRRSLIAVRRGGTREEVGTVRERPS